MRTNSLLTRCNVRYISHLGVPTHLSFPLRTNSVLTPYKQGAVLSRYSIGLGNENELLTHTLQATCGTFLSSAIRPISLSHTPSSNVWYIALQPPE